MFGHRLSRPASSRHVFGQIIAQNELPWANEGQDMELINQLQPLLYALFAAILSYMREAWQWWLAQILSVPWGRVGELPGSKVLLLIASAGIVAYFLFRAARELYSAGEKAFSAFLTLLRVFAKTVPPILLAGLAAAAGAWVVNHVQM